MGRYAQLVMGPAGSGKSTYCSTIAKHGEAIGRTIHVVNLDPAADEFDYPCILDIRELISVEDVMDDPQLRLGPNGGLMYCMEHLASNLDWLEDALGEGQDEYILLDCPGQIELYTHMPTMRTVVNSLSSWGFTVCGVFLLDASFMLDMSKFFSGVLVALSAMVNIEIPHVNVLTKMDLLSKKNKEMVESFLEPDFHFAIADEEDTRWNRKHRKLTRALAHMIEDFSLVRLIPLDSTDEESVAEVLLTIDTAIQYGEDEDVRIRYPEDVDMPEEERGNGDGD